MNVLLMLGEKKADKKTLVTNPGLFALKRSRAGFFFFSPHFIGDNLPTPTLAN